jgi:hypothetical protein
MSSVIVGAVAVSEGSQMTISAKTAAVFVGRFVNWKVFYIIH